MVHSTVQYCAAQHNTVQYNKAHIRPPCQKINPKYCYEKINFVALSKIKDQIQ